MKILTVCQRGNVRSVAAAYILKDQMEFSDTIAMGVETASLETQNILFNWADKILVVAGRDVYEKIPAEFIFKIEWLNIGPDIWQNPKSEDLLAKLNILLRELLK